MLFYRNKFTSIFLAPLSALYGGITEIRNYYFQQKFFPIAKLPKPTISVGNLSVGGTGKTPVVRFLARYFNQLNKETAILTRGYGRKTKKTIILTCKNYNTLSYELTGDEPRLLANDLQKGMVVIDANRLNGGNKALKNTNPDIFILDDAFQHRKIYRDFDIVTLDATDLWGMNQLLPLGKLREPISQLKRADLIWITRMDQTPKSIKDIQSEIRNKINKPLIFSEHSPDKIVNLKNQISHKPDTLQGKDVIAFCGIANPESFKRTLVDLGANITEFYSFSDHYHFQHNDLIKLIGHKKKLNDSCLITTEKDAVRIQDLKEEEIKEIYYLEIKIKILNNEHILKKTFEAKGFI